MKIVCIGLVEPTFVGRQARARGDIVGINHLLLPTQNKIEPLYFIR